MTAGLTYLAYNYIPFSLWALPIWVVYAALTGTVATGLCINNISNFRGFGT